MPYGANRCLAAEPAHPLNEGTLVRNPQQHNNDRFSTTRARPDNNTDNTATEPPQRNHP